MGGAGSGRWYRWNTRDTTETARALDINRWVREDLIAPAQQRVGMWIWTHSVTGKTTANIGYETNTRDIAKPYVRLFYTITRAGQPSQSLDYRIRLVTTQPHFGGLRWWFICPLSVNGRLCNRRVAKLYLPSDAVCYGCRVCYNLTYQSCNESSSRTRMFANLLIQGMLPDVGDIPVHDLLHYLRAADYLRKRERRLEKLFEKLARSGRPGRP